MYADWGLTKLYERINHEMADETQHAAALIERILFLEGIPDLSQQDGLNIGKTVPEMLRNDLDFEYKVIGDLKNAIAVCEQEQDYQTRDILLKILADTEEDHGYWLEKQLGLIEKIGLQNYLQSQI
jgi:bacterioferritin